MSLNWHCWLGWVNGSRRALRGGLAVITRLSGSQGQQNRLTSRETDGDRPSDGGAAARVVALCRGEAGGQGEGVGNDRRPDVGFEVIEPAPSAARETKSSFQAGYVGFDTGPEAFQLAVHPAALDHGVDCQGTLLVEGDILDAQGLCPLQIVEAGVAAIAGRLSRWRTLARDVALEHGKDALGIGRVAGLDDDIEDQAALARG